VAEDGLGSGLFDFRRAEQYNIPWALGSDIGGGPWLSMFDVIRSFVAQNRARGIAEATYIKGLYRATLKSAELLEMANESGNLQSGKWANFVRVPFPKTGKPDDDAEQVLDNLIAPLANERHRYDDLVETVYYKGVKVYPK
jgi:guanine deaminase